MDRVIMDASVFIKWASDEEYSDRAYALRDAHISDRLAIAVPSIFGYEVLNSIKYSKGATQERLDEVSEVLDNYGFEVFELQNELLKLTTRIALKYKITIYDAAYVALAIMTDSCLYTADIGIIDAVKLPNVRHIKNFE